VKVTLPHLEPLFDMWMMQIMLQKGMQIQLIIGYITVQEIPGGGSSSEQV